MFFSVWALCSDHCTNFLTSCLDRTLYTNYFQWVRLYLSIKAEINKPAFINPKQFNTNSYFEEAGLLLRGGANPECSSYLNKVNMTCVEDWWGFLSPTPTKLLLACLCTILSYWSWGILMVLVPWIGDGCHLGWGRWGGWSGYGLFLVGWWIPRLDW